MALNIETICEIVIGKIERNSYRNVYNINVDEYRFGYDICKDAPNWIGTGAEEYLTQQIMAHTPHEKWEKFLNQTYDDIKGLLGWDVVGGDARYNNGWIPVDGLDEHCYTNNHKWDYIHIIGKSDGAYGEQLHFHYGMNVGYCRKLKSRKAFENLEIGKFYKIRMSNFTKNGRFSKYEYEYEEMDEYDYIWESLLTYWDSHPKTIKE